MRGLRQNADDDKEVAGEGVRGHEEFHHKVPGVHTGVPNGETFIASRSTRADPAVFTRQSFYSFLQLVYFRSGRAARKGGG